MILSMKRLTIIWNSPFLPRKRQKKPV